MTASAIDAEAAQVNIVVSVTAIARRRTRELALDPGRVAVVAESAFVRTVQCEIRLLRMVEGPEVPSVGVVAE